MFTTISTRIKALKPVQLVLVALAGVAVLGAGTATASKLITGADIKNRSVTSADVAKGTLTNANIKNESVLSEDIMNNHVLSKDIKDGGVRSVDLSDGLRAELAQRVKDGVDGKNGVDGKDGARGPQGEQGEAGPRGENYTDQSVPAQALELQGRWNGAVTIRKDAAGNVHYTGYVECNQAPPVVDCDMSMFTVPEEFNTTGFKSFGLLATGRDAVYNKVAIVTPVELGGYGFSDEFRPQVGLAVKPGYTVRFDGLTYPGS